MTINSRTSGAPLDLGRIIIQHTVDNVAQLQEKVRKPDETFLYLIFSLKIRWNSREILKNRQIQ
jgi:hypothetical protein